MAKYKVLGAVAHNTAHSFASAMNYAYDDYVMGKLLVIARRTGESEFFIDFITGDHSQTFDAPPFTHLVRFYSKTFWDNVASQGSAISLVASARLTVRFDLITAAPTDLALFRPGRYWCGVELTDDRGVDHSKQLTGYWTPEPRRLGLLDRLAHWIRGTKVGNVV